MGSVNSSNSDSFLRVHEEVCPTVYAPEAPLSKIAEEADSQEYIDAIERMEPEVEDLASRIVDNPNIDISSPDDDA